MLRKLERFADPVSLWAPGAGALLAVAAGAIALFDSANAAIAWLGIVGGALSAVGIWATGAASKARDEQLQRSIQFSMWALDESAKGAPHL